MPIISSLHHPIFTFSVGLLLPRINAVKTNLSKWKVYSERVKHGKWSKKRMEDEKKMMKRRRRSKSES
jgi:hypothetical protein